MLALVAGVPSLLIPHALPWNTPRAMVRMDEAAPAEAPAEEKKPAASVTIKKPEPKPAEQTIRDLVASGAIEVQSTEAFSKLKKIEQDFDRTQDPAAFKAQLIGSWKLAAASDAFWGVTNSAPKNYQKPLGHVQIFSKPDPMALFSGDKDKLFFMETVEVVGCAMRGVTAMVSIKGGFSVSPELKVAETYTKKVVNEDVVEENGMSLNAWDCIYMTDSLRVCRSSGGAYRVYDKVDEDAAAQEVAKMMGTNIPIDPEAGKEEQQEEEEEYDDPNIPAWQKRIDKADGVKRTKNGTPIRQDGPIGGGPTGPPTSK